MEPEGGKEQDTLIPCKIFRGKAKRHLAEGNGAEILAQPCVLAQGCVLEEGASLLHSTALGSWAGAVKILVSSVGIVNLDSQHV